MVLFGVFQSYLPAAKANEDPDEENILASATLSDLLNIGFRQSLIKARENKKQAVGSLDSIFAEDIADFPDLNLAESIQRMPGIAITREGGEGRQISLRGLGANFTQVQLNGMEVLPTSSSPMDSRNAVQRAKYFDFNVFHSELMSQIDIHKSYSADKDEGGISGTVGLKTPRPFDHNGFESVLSGSLRENEYSHDTGPRVTGFISNTWNNTFGALASVTYSKKDTVERGVNTYRWRQIALDSDQIGNSITDATVRQQLENGDIWFARGNRASVWENTQERIGLTTSFQYKPNDDTMVELNIVHSELNNDRSEWHLVPTGTSSTALGTVDNLELKDNNGDIEAVYASFNDVRLRTESRVDTADTTFDQIVLNTEWQINDKFSIKTLIGKATSEYEHPELDKAYLETIDESYNVTTDYRGGKRFDPSINFDESITLNSPLWRVRELDLRELYIDNEFENFKFDFKYEFNGNKNVTFGLSYKFFENSNLNLRQDNLVGSIPTSQNSDTRNLSESSELNSLIFTYKEHPDIKWLATSVDDMQSFYGIDDKLGLEDAVQASVNSGNTVSEKTIGSYLQYNTKGKMFNKPFRANVGLRSYATDTEWRGPAGDLNLTLSGDYSGLLPSFNYVTEVSDTFLVRFSGSKNVTRPDLEDMANPINIDTDGNEILIPNMNLEPVESENLELTFEWYFDEVGYMAIGFFQKRLSGFPVRSTREQTYGELGLPLELLADGQDANTVFTVEREENSDDTTVDGVELSFQRDLDFLPAPFDQFGVITNITVVDGDAVYDDVQGTGEQATKPIIGLSKLSSNFTVYYETDKWGARVAGAYRDEYISRVESGLRDEDERGFHSTLNIDFSSFYMVSETVKVTFEGINLTNVQEEQYSDSNDRPYNITTSGTTYYLRLTYKM